MKIKVGIVDDHQLFVKSLTLLLETSGQFEVTVTASNGLVLQQMLGPKTILPDIMLIDVDMPKMNGYETARWLEKTYPIIKLVALSMNQNDYAVIEMIKAGCCAYLLKDTSPVEFEKALAEIHSKGYYNGDACNINYRRLILKGQEADSLKFSEKELEFIRFACSEMTYKEIAVKMAISERSVDSIREQLFGKLNIQSRVGLCLEAIRRNIVTV